MRQDYNQSCFLLLAPRSVPLAFPMHHIAAIP